MKDERAPHSTIPAPDLRQIERHYEGFAKRTATDAADRLAELDAQRPPCPMCGGFCAVERPGEPIEACPDCVDGKVSIDQLAARWNAVQRLSPGSRIQAVLDAERSIR